MTREEINWLLGTPQTPRLFENDVWLYTYQLRDAGFVGKTRLLSVELIFDENKKLQTIKVLKDDFDVAQ